MAIHPLYNYDCLANISHYLHFRKVCECESVCTVWRDAMRQPNVWEVQSHYEKIPCVIAAPNENRDRKADFKFLFRFTMGAEWYGKAGIEIPDDEVRMISKEEFDRLKEDDPFDKELYLAQQSSGGGKRTYEDAFPARVNKVRKIWETFVIVVAPRYIKKYFELSLLRELIKNGFKPNESENHPSMNSVSDMHWFDEFVPNKIENLDHLAALHGLDWDLLIEQVCDKEFFATLKTFFHKDQKFDSYTDFLKDLFNSLKDSNNKLLLELVVRKFMNKPQIGVLEELETKKIHLHIPISMTNLDVLFRHVRKSPFLSERIDPNLRKKLDLLLYDGKTELYLIRKEVPELTLNQNSTAQRELMKICGFISSGVLLRSWYNWVELMRTNQCPDDIQHPAVRAYSKTIGVYTTFGCYRKTSSGELAPGLQYGTLLGGAPHLNAGVIPAISLGAVASASSQSSANPTSQK